MWLTSIRRSTRRRRRSRRWTVPSSGGRCMRSQVNPAAARALFSPSLRVLMCPQRGCLPWRGRICVRWTGTLTVWTGHRSFIRPFICSPCWRWWRMSCSRWSCSISRRKWRRQRHGSIWIRWGCRRRSTKRGPAWSAAGSSRGLLSPGPSRRAVRFF